MLGKRLAIKAMPWSRLSLMTRRLAVAGCSSCRQFILPDAIAASALLEALQIDFGGYVKGLPGGCVSARSAEDLARQMSRHWPAPGRSNAPSPFPELKAAPSCH